MPFPLSLVPVFLARFVKLQDMNFNTRRADFAETSPKFNRILKILLYFRVHLQLFIGLI